MNSSQIINLGNAPPPLALASPGDEILQQLKDVRDLPTLPTVFMHIMRALRNPNTSVKELARIIEADQAMTMKILKLINSSFYGLSRGVDSVHQAIVLLGSNTLKNIVISTSVFKAMGGGESSLLFDRKAFWQHSIGCGMIARFLGNQINCGRDEEGFIAGIIHDIGKLVLDHYFHDHLTLVVQRVDKDQVSFYQAEQEILGLTHAEIGARLAEFWKIPDKLVAVVAEHHQFNPASPHALLVALIQLSDRLVRSFHVGCSGDDLIPTVPLESWRLLNLNPDRIVAWEADLQAEIAKGRELLDALLN